MSSANKANETSALPFERVLRAFEEAGVKHLVVGGQAAVAYGVSQFTLDADLWVEPTARNLVRLRRALAGLQARLRFLPPLELRYLKRGHGVHFTIPHGSETFYLDILGKPPRVDSFDQAWRSATLIDWRSLQVSIVDVRRLVATKKTNRDQDYVAIQRLGELVFKQVRHQPKERADAVDWLLRESRTPGHLKTVARSWPEAKAALPNISRPAALLAAQNARLPEIENALDEEKRQYQQANLDYWKPLLHELRSIRSAKLKSTRRRQSNNSCSKN